MVTACWSVKGGSGTTVVATALGILAARHSGNGALLVDLCGDISPLLGLSHEGPGIFDWLMAGEDVPSDALSRLEVAGPDALHVLVPGGTNHKTPQAGISARGEVLSALLAADPRPVVVDCGTEPSDTALSVAACASNSLLVIRPCYLALCKAMNMDLRPTGVVLVNEFDRSLTRDDVEDALGVPVHAEIMIDPVVARAVDAGVLSSRFPKSLERALRHVA